MTDEKLESLFLATSLCIKHLISIEDSERTRIASLALLQNRVHYFYPQMHSIMKKANRLAQNHGGELVAPKESFISNLIKILFGFDRLKQIKMFKWYLTVFPYKNYDRLLYIFSKKLLTITRITK